MGVGGSPGCVGGGGCKKDWVRKGEQASLARFPLS